jgi:ectoine hydroxylase-related dioxygenase (phytanoyl-CoA dioxygenase family)
MPTIEDHRRRIVEDGFAVAPRCLDATVVAELTELAESVRERGASVRRRGEVYAIRNLLDVLPSVAKVLDLPRVRRLVESILGPQAFLVRAILFDKNAGGNWLVPWHQDLSIAVQSRADVAGFGPWSIKAGVPHVRPPVAVLEQMLAVRLHLDPCGEANGPLRVIPGSHRAGLLTAAAIERWTAEHRQIACLVPAGGAVMMRPLLLHASSKATAARRRVLHFEFAATELPTPLEWRRAK